MPPKASPERHREWLRLVETSGTPLTVPQLTTVWPHGPEHLDTDLAKAVRQNLEVFRDDPATYAKRWVRWVLSVLLEHDDGVSLLEGPPIAHLSHLVADRGVTLRPNLVIAEPDADITTPRMLIAEHPPGTVLDARSTSGRWVASPVERMVELCRGLGVPIGLVTDGETWTVVAVPDERVPETLTWTADLWLDERITLEAFTMLLSAERFFGVDEGETPEELLCADIDAEEEVTETLGIQVKKAVELLVDTVSRANRERHGELLADVEGREVYQAAVTVMMRLVFLLSAEERGLFLLGDETYDESYAISTLREQLLEERFRNEAAMEYRLDAWHRVLASFRLVHDGVQHENLRLPAYGGALFDPDRFPFLEGRVHGEQVEQAVPLPIDNRTMLAILDSLQVLTPETAKAKKRLGEAVNLSFRNLDVEQIGHVYEGLLDHSVVLLSEPALGLTGKIEPEIGLHTLEEKAGEGDAALRSWLKETADLTPKQVEKALAHKPDDVELSRLRAACDNDRELAARVAPFLGLLRTDLRGLPQVFLADSYCVTKSSDRRSSGTYYTPRVLAEEMVRYTLEPLVHSPGPAEGADPEDWRLRPWEEIVELKVCDMAMGSGAFLVASCRYLADRLLEAWEAQGTPLGVPIGLPGAEGAPVEIPVDDSDREIYARRLVADRCIYGVDVNPMAVEMAKLSLWLVTLAKDKPFSFVDHALRCGDSLLGITSLDQLRRFHLDPKPGSAIDRRLGVIQDAIGDRIDLAMAKRQELESFPVVDVRDAEAKRRLLSEASAAIEPLRIAADALVAACLSTASSSRADTDAVVLETGLAVARMLDPSIDEEERGDRQTDVASTSHFRLDRDRPFAAPERRPFHWALEFPEIFSRGRFDAVVGNPPFLGGQKITGAFGTIYRDHLICYVAGGRKGSADLVAYFFRRASSVTSRFGFIATNTVAQGDSSEVGLTELIDAGWTIDRAESSATWPGDATIEVAKVWATDSPWKGASRLDGRDVATGIDEMLYPKSLSGWRKRPLDLNRGIVFQGSIVLGEGFMLSPGRAQALIESDDRYREVLFPYLGGEDLNSSPTHEASRWVINFHDWPEERAQEYPVCYEQVKRLVEPVRRNNSRAARRERWWMYAEPARSLYRAIRNCEAVIAVALTSKVVQPCSVSARQVFAHSLGVFALDDRFLLGVLASSVHYRWAVRYASSMRTDTRYTPSDVFETFPRPIQVSEEIRSAVLEATDAVLAARQKLMVPRDIGLTSAYNMVHEQNCVTADVVDLREAHARLDSAVLRAYGWDDLVGSHDFFPVRGQGTRFTLQADTADEIIERLLRLNREYSVHGDVESGATYAQVLPLGVADGYWT